MQAVEAVVMDPIETIDLKEEATGTITTVGLIPLEEVVALIKQESCSLLL